MIMNGLCHLYFVGSDWSDFGKFTWTNVTSNISANLRSKTNFISTHRGVKQMNKCYDNIFIIIFCFYKILSQDAHLVFKYPWVLSIGILFFQVPVLGWLSTNLKLIIYVHYYVITPLLHLFFLHSISEDITLNKKKLEYWKFQFRFEISYNV